MKKIFYGWEEAYHIGVNHCGGKGWNLARLDHFGFNIPNGFVLDSSFYIQTIQTAELSKLIKQVEKISDNELLNHQAYALLENIRANIINSKLSKETQEQLALAMDEHDLTNTPLAIRSSANLEDSTEYSFAGIHESYLNVKDQINIEQAILQCFASLWSLGAVTYRRKMKIKDDELSCAVVLMELINAKSSGVAFSCNPANGREDITLINTNFGLGESIVNGDIEPDSYQVNSNSLTIEDIQIGTKKKQTILNATSGTILSSSSNSAQVLDTEQIQQLTKLTQCIYWAYDSVHQDIEWAYDGKDFFILQARPVTIINSFKFDGFENQEEIWSNGNFKDSAPMVQNTLWQSMVFNNVNMILKAPFDLIGYKIPDGLNLVRLYNGRAYLNISLLQWIYFDCTGYKPSKYRGQVKMTI